MTTEEPSHEIRDNARFIQQLQSDGPRREVVGRWSLKPVGKRPPLHIYLYQLWGRRHFIWADSRARAFSAGRGMLLGNAWLVLQPLLNGAIYLLIFGILLQTSRGIDNFIGYLIVGVFLFQFTSRCLSNGATAITGAKAIIRGFSFPRAMLPISVVARETLNMVPVLVTMFLLITFIPPVEATSFSPPHADVSWRWGIFPAIFALQIIFNLGVTFLAARLVASLPDARHLLSFVNRLWFFGSAVIYSFDRFVDNPQLLSILQLNPAFIVLDMSRNVLLYATSPDPHQWLLIALWSTGTLVVGFLLFWRGEELYAK